MASPMGRVPFTGSGSALRFFAIAARCSRVIWLIGCSGDRPHSCANTGPMRAGISVTSTEDSCLRTFSANSR